MKISQQGRKKHLPNDEPRLVRRLTQLASDYGRYGYRRVTALPENSVGE